MVVAWPHLQPQTMTFFFAFTPTFFFDATCLQMLVLKLGNEIFHISFMHGVA